MIKEAECSLKIPQTFCQVHTERSVLSVCLDQDCHYRGMFCYQCIKYHYQHLDKTFEIKEFLNLISENINDLSFNMLPTSPSPSLKDIYKNKFDQLHLNKENLLRQKELVIEAVCKYVDLAIQNAENKVELIETKNPASQDTQSLQELTTYQEKFFDLANLQPDELYDLLIYFSKFIHKEDDKIEIINYSPSKGQIPKSQSLMIENDLDNTSQNLRNSELVLQKLTGILDHLPPDDRSAHQKLSCLKIAPQQTPRRFGQPVTFQPNPNPGFGGYNNTYHHNSISLSNHFQRASSNQGNNQGQMNNMNNHDNNHNNHIRNNHFSNNNNNNNYQNQGSSNSGQNSNKFTHYTNNIPSQNSNNTQQTREREESNNSNNNNTNNNNNNINSNNNNNNSNNNINNNNNNKEQLQQNNEGGENSNSGASSFLQKFQQKLNENSKNQSENQQNSQSNNSNSTAQPSQQNSQSSSNNLSQQTNSNKTQGSSQANITKLQNLVQQSNAQMASSNSQNQQLQGFASLAQHFQSSSQQQNQSNPIQNDSNRISYQQKKQQLANQKRNELFSEQRLALRSVEHFCDSLEVGYNYAWCISFRTQKECALNGIYHMPIFVYDSTVGVSLESAYLQLSLFEGNSSFSKKLYEQSFLLKKTTKHISSDETNLINVLEKFNLNTSYKLRKNSDYTIVVRNKTSEQEDPSSLKQLYILYGDDQSEDLKNQPESEGAKLISFIKTNTSNLSQQLENTKLITQNNDSLENPQLTDYFVPYLSISHLSQEQQHHKTNFYSSTNQTGEDTVLQSLQENEQKTPKRTEYEHNHLGNHYNNNNNQSQRGFKDFMNNFKIGNGLGGQSSSQHGNNQNNENDFNKYSNRTNQGNNKRKYLGGEGSQSNYNSSRSNNSNTYSHIQSSSYQQSSSSYSNNNYEKSSIIPGFVPQKKQKK
ncbi:hypothetical protein ABPG72_016840 [Tetrahymena utriculariae]